MVSAACPLTLGTKAWMKPWIGTIRSAAIAGGFPASGAASPFTTVSITCPSVRTTEIPRATPTRTAAPSSSPCRGDTRRSHR